MHTTFNVLTVSGNIIQTFDNYWDAKKLADTIPAASVEVSDDVKTPEVTTPNRPRPCQTCDTPTKNRIRVAGNAIPCCSKCEKNLFKKAVR